MTENMFALMFVLELLTIHILLPIISQIFYTAAFPNFQIFKSPTRLKWDKCHLEIQSRVIIIVLNVNNIVFTAV